MKSLKNQRYYIGQTEDFNKRFKEHNSGKSKATKYGMPWVAVHKEVCDSRKEAIRKEKKLKSLKKRKYIDNLIAG
ncbi:MAG: GIY-YIG nuclease family protein [Candidatus Portnoybacteria bacterium]|nr:GIY-YIG nuclease family protein [Candidatus Portnoybacteria bacterium]